MKDSILSIGSGFLIGVILVTAGFSSLMEEYQAKAVELGAAEWVLDQKTGKTTFTWKEKP